MKSFHENRSLAGFSRSGNGRLIFSLALICFTAVQAYSQIYTYYNVNFTISGPTSICPDGTTSHSYTGVSESLTWSVTVVR